MKLNLDKVPSNLDEAVTILKEGLESKDYEFIKDPKSDSVDLHFGFGMYLRNEWSLWDKETVIVKWFKENYGIDHADDLSGIILDCLWQDIRGKPRRDKEKAQSFIEHWKKYG